MQRTTGARGPGASCLLGLKPLPNLYLKLLRNAVSETGITVR